MKRIDELKRYKINNHYIAYTYGTVDSFIDEVENKIKQVEELSKKFNQDKTRDIEELKEKIRNLYSNFHEDVRKYLDIDNYIYVDIEKEYILIVEFDLKHDGKSNSYSLKEDTTNPDDVKYYIEIED